MKKRFEQLTETELGHTIVPSFKQATICIRRFFGDEPRIGHKIVIEGEKVFHVDGKNRVLSFIRQPSLDSMNGEWIIVSVDIGTNSLMINIESKVL